MFVNSLALTFSLSVWVKNSLPITTKTILTISPSASTKSYHVSVMENLSINRKSKEKEN